MAMATDRDWIVVDDTVDFDSIFAGPTAHVREDDKVDLVADEDPEWRAWREMLTR
jgi:hypothetical protein